MTIHPTAIVSPKAEIDGTVEIGPHCVIDRNVRLAAGCRLYHQVYLTGWTRIEENCVLHPGVIVGHEPQDVKYGGERSYCRVGRGTVLREYVTIHRGTEPESETVVDEECFLLGASHVGHNCRVGRNATIINGVVLGGHVEVGDHVTIGGLAGIHQFIRVGSFSMIAGAARVVQDVIPFALMDAFGRIVGPNRVGIARRKLPVEQVKEIHTAFRLLFRTALPFDKAVEQLAESMTTDAGREIVRFIQSDSRRGIAKKGRRPKEPTIASGGRE